MNRGSKMWTIEISIINVRVHETICEFGGLVKLAGWPSKTSRTSRMGRK